ncbi:hypothetical protein CcrC1_gp490 [Caulobacter phage C1]|nr:hypothetical protein CcrC1_gp490 [Caulobacter phage C1]UTU08703.1 hypothetical protein CcrC2_gp476 [Caulobacter phage C2]UTU09236.1 hypothetical protein CcrJ4_gp489 [Caulobacter phage J4]WGN97365.1 hypothetical protein [Bertelyvirus sp.]WGN97903.1 hypothetical protein [Bertelyvirus sp.]
MRPSTLALGLAAVVAALALRLTAPVSARTKLMSLATRPPWVGRKLP